MVDSGSPNDDSEEEVSDASMSGCEEEVIFSFSIPSSSLNHNCYCNATR